MKRRDFAAACCSALTPIRALSQSKGPSVVIEWPPIQLVSGSTLSPQSWQGQAAVVVFWETHCPFCKRHNTHIDKLYRATLGQTLRVLTVALDTDEAAVQSYIASNNFSFPVAMDGGVLRQRLTPRRVIPMTCVLDRLGRLVQAIPGEMSEADVMALARPVGQPPQSN